MIKICDFGLSGKHGSIRIGNFGTCAYMPPELIKIILEAPTLPTATYQVLKAADVFSFALVMYSMTFSAQPDLGDKVRRAAVQLRQLNAAVEDAIIDDQATIGRMERWHELPAKLQSTMKRMLSEDPSDRPEVSEVVAEVGYMGTH